MIDANDPAGPKLLLHHREWVAAYPITSAQWNLYKDDCAWRIPAQTDPATPPGEWTSENNNDRINLWLRVETGKRINASPIDPEDTFDDAIHWELNLLMDGLRTEDLQAGFLAEIPAAYDERQGGWITNLNYGHHDGTERNQIEVVARKKDRIRFRIKGEFVNECWPAGNKNWGTIEADAWLDLYLRGHRSSG